MSRAEYMRQYRLKRKGQTVETVVGRPHEIILDLGARILALEEEVARLKRELAARPRDYSEPPYPAPDTRPNPYGGGFNTRPFTPVPKVRKK